MKAILIIMPAVSLLLVAVATQSVSAFYGPALGILSATLFLFGIQQRTAWLRLMPQLPSGQPPMLFLSCGALWFITAILNLHWGTIHSVLAERANACVLIAFFFFVAPWVLVQQRRIKRSRKDMEGEKAP